MNLKLLLLTIILPSLLGLMIGRVTKGLHDYFLRILRKEKIKGLYDYCKLYMTYFYICLFILVGIYLIFNFDIGTDKSITESNAFISAILVLSLAFLIRIETVTRGYDNIGVLNLFIQASFIIIFITMFKNISNMNVLGTIYDNSLALIENFLLFSKMILGYIFVGSLGLSLFGEYFIRHELKLQSETKED